MFCHRYNIDKYIMIIITTYHYINNIHSFKYLFKYKYVKSGKLFHFHQLITEETRFSNKLQSFCVIDIYSSTAKQNKNTYKI